MVLRPAALLSRWILARAEVLIVLKQGGILRGRLLAVDNSKHGTLGNVILDCPLGRVIVRGNNIAWIGKVMGDV